MNEVNLKHHVKRESLLLTAFVLFSQFISENVFAEDFPIKDYVKVDWDAKTNSVLITATVYSYLSGPKTEPGFLENCKFEAIDDRRNCHKLFKIHTERYNYFDFTVVDLINYLKNAVIKVKNDLYPVGLEWQEGKTATVKVPIEKSLAKVDFAWKLDENFKNVRSIRIDGNWTIKRTNKFERFKNIIYDLHRTGPSALKSNTPDINTKASENNTVKMYKDSEAIVINGADPGTNIKVYTTTGAEIKSTVSNNDVVKIDLPAKQIYIVHIGNSRYKVAF